MKVLWRRSHWEKGLILLLVLFISACASKPSTKPSKKPPTPGNYHDSTMDFSAIKTVAVLPLANATADKLAGERVRDVLITTLMSTETMYVIPTGEIIRAIGRAGITDPTSPSTEEIKKLGGILKVNAVITGVVREYGEVRSGPAAANVLSLSLAMTEVDTGKVVWTSHSTRGGISTLDRLFGGGGEPMNNITQKVVDDLLDKLFK